MSVVYGRDRRRGRAAAAPAARDCGVLEDERWLAMALLLPTVVLLGLFIAYPFVKGVLLSVTDPGSACPAISSGCRIS